MFIYINYIYISLYIMFLYIKNISFASPSLFCITKPDTLSVCLSVFSKQIR